MHALEVKKNLQREKDQYKKKDGFALFPGAH
jgi:hypothetical protein